MATSPLARAFVNSSVNTTVERFKAALEAERTAAIAAERKAAIAAEINALALEAAAASGRATRASSPGGFYTAAAEQAAAEKAAAEKAAAEQAGAEVGAAAAAAAAATATATAVPEQAAIEKAGAEVGATAEAGQRESKAQTTAAAAEAASGAAAVVRTFYGASDTPLARPPRRGARARGPAASILSRVLRPWRRAAEVEIAAEMVEIAAEDAAEDAAEIAEVVEIDATVASEAAAEIEAEARPPSRAQPQDRYTSEVGAEIEVACSPAEACEAYADLESFPQFVPLLKSVRMLGGGRSEWELQLPGIVIGFVRVVGMGSLVKWQAASSVDAPHRLTWRSLSGFENAGAATFVPLGGDRAGCRVVVRMTYSVPIVLKPLENSKWVKSLMSTTMRVAMETFRERLETKGRV